MAENRLIEDARLGGILLQPNVRARRFIFRVREGRLVAVMPPSASAGELRRAIEKLRPRLERMMERAKEQQSPDITPEWRIETAEFRFWSEEARVSKLCLRQQRGQLVCYYPPGTDFGQPRVQAWLLRSIEESLRRHAKVLFPPRLKAMAETRGLTYKSLRIHKTRSRWGSCSAGGNINLSLYLMLLPRHLQDFVMQHELTHLVEMNHGSRFHALLDAALDGRSRACEKEMKSFSLQFIIPCVR